VKASFINFKGQGSRALVGPKRQCYNGMWLHAILLFVFAACLWGDVISSMMEHRLIWETPWRKLSLLEIYSLWVPSFIPQTGMEPAIHVPCHLAPLFLLSLKHSFITRRLKSYCTAVCDNCCFLQGSTRLSGNASNTQTGLNADDSPSLV